MVSIVSGERWRCPLAEAAHPELVAAIWQADLVTNSLPEAAGRGEDLRFTPPSTVGHLNRFDRSFQRDPYTGGPCDGHLQDAMCARR
jgi:hypothetical protein